MIDISKIDRLTDELTELVEKLKPWYAAELRNVFVVNVYSWGEGDAGHEPPYGYHLFDIYAEHINWRVISHLIPNDAVPVIRKIQSKMMEIEREAFDL